MLGLRRSEGAAPLALTPPIVVVTRPEPGASDTAARLADRGLRPVVAPLLAIRPGTLRLPVRPPAAVLATSANALEALDGLRAACGGRIPFLAVGDETARRARDAGWTDVASAGRDALALAELAAARFPPGRPRPRCRAAGDVTASGPAEAGALLLASGAGQGAALAADLRRRGCRVVRRTAYAQVPARRLPLALAGVLGAATADGDECGAVLFLSRSASEVFAVLLPDAMRPELRRFRALAISEAAASPIAALPWDAVRVALRPTQDGVLDLL